MSTGNDRSLRFYNEVLGLDRLHYGLWALEDELTFENLKKAQIRYENHLIDNIPAGVKSVLDVGCGTGVLAKKLLEKSYQVEGLSPDINQQKIFHKEVNAPFNHMRFEDFRAENKFDCIIMSESCQYIAVDKIFENAGRALKANGYLMICDYFVLDNASGELSKSGHNYAAFLKRLENSGFEVVVNEDITDRVTKTLDLAKEFVGRVMTGLDIATEKFRSKHPLVTKLVLWLFRGKNEKMSRQSALLDSESFRSCKTYRLLVLQAKS